jgi:hypothetical protein
MSETAALPANPLLSPDFDKARRLSRILSTVLTIGFWLGVVFLVCLAIYAMWVLVDSSASTYLRHPKIPSGGKAAGAMAIVLVAFVPCLFALHYARRVFTGFSAGEVFTAGTITAMRATALWLVIAGLIPPRPLVLIIGVAAFVAAYVIAEARRISDDNASIV